MIYFSKPMPVKDKIKSSIPDKDEKGNVREIKMNDDIIRFRNGIIHDTLSSVDIKSIVKAGGRIIKIYEEIVYEKNLEIDPYKEFVTRLFAFGKKEEKNKVGDTLVKLRVKSRIVEFSLWENDTNRY